MSSRVRRLAVTFAAALALIFPASIAGAGPSEKGCNGLYEVARFATFKNVGDTKGHQMVHYQFERRGCGHHH